MADPWDVPDRRQVSRWRDRHRMAVAVAGSLAIGHTVASFWALLVCAVWGVMVLEAHHRLDRRYDRIQEEVRNATG